MGRLIDADAAVESLTEYGNGRAVYIGVEEAVRRIEQLPSAQPERKTGRWIPCPQNASWLYVYKCSECGGYLQISDVDGIGITAKYCSYCGAKMEGR